MVKSSIADKLSTQRSTNNFDLLRFIAATLVIVSHCFALSGKAFEPLAWLSAYETCGGLAVAIFFIISGFLITGSWFSDENIFSFLKKRVLRIFPALIWVVLLSVFVLGPLVTNLPLKDYFKNDLTYLYINNIYLTYIYYPLPGVFTENPWPNAVNGSLWTMPIEIMMYAMIGFLGSIRLLKMKWVMPALLIFAVYLFINYYINYSNALILSMLLSQTAKLSIYYIMGSIYYIYRDKIILSIYIFIPALVIYFLGYGHAYGHFTAFIALPYIVIYLAFVVNKVTNNWGKYGDFSYGMYIYAFPVQQTIMYLCGKTIDTVTYFFLTFIITLLLSVQSWYLIEKRALKYKSFNLKDTIKRIHNQVLMEEK